MKKPKIKVNILKEDSGYSATAIIGKDFIGTQGETFEELKANILEAVNLAYEDNEIIYTLEEFDLMLDLPSFFHFFRVINAKALSERIGMNQSLLAQYISGKKKPSADQAQRILRGVQQIGKELTEIRLLI